MFGDFYAAGSVSSPRVQDDTTPPVAVYTTPTVAVCQNITVQLDASGNASITAAEVDGGSSAASGIASLAVSPSAFTTPDVGSNNVMLTVTDNNGNQDSCTSVVIVEDNVPPVALTPDIPVWIKNTAEWWCEGTINDQEFANALQYLISEGIIVIPPTQSGQGTSQDIPAWIKNNACWWADGLIDDSEFVAGIQYLIQEGIIVV